MKEPTIENLSAWIKKNPLCNLTVMRSAFGCMQGPRFGDLVNNLSTLVQEGKIAVIHGDMDLRTGDALPKYEWIHGRKKCEIHKDFWRRGCTVCEADADSIEYSFQEWQDYEG